MPRIARNKQQRSPLTGSLTMSSRTKTSRPNSWPLLWTGLTNGVTTVSTTNESVPRQRKKRIEVVSSHPARVRIHARHLRNHCSVENTLHETLDVTFTEDANRIRNGNGSDIISALQRLGLSILKQDTTVKDNGRGITDAVPSNGSNRIMSIGPPPRWMMPDGRMEIRHSSRFRP